MNKTTKDPNQEPLESSNLVEQSGTKTIGVMVVDDHQLIRSGLQRALGDTQDIRVIEDAGSGEEAIKLCRQGLPDVVLMDINMSPGIDGITTTEKLLKQYPDLKILMVSMHNHELYTDKAIHAGAAGYITKDAPIKDLAEAIRRIHEGNHYLSPDIMTRQATRHLSGYKESPFELLSKREAEVSRQLIRGICAKDIAEAMKVSDKTINSYRYRIFDKLKISNDVELTLMALRYGFINSDELPKE